jgi:PAS domain S-box-containing protein
MPNHNQSPNQTTIDLKAAIAPYPLTISPQATVEEAIALISNFSQEAIGEEPGSSSIIVVIESDLRTVGMLTERDIIRAILLRNATANAQQQPLHCLSVEEIMTQPVVTLRESELTDIFAIIDFLKKHRLRHLPIVDQSDRLLGLISHETLTRLICPVDLMGQQLLEAEKVALLERRNQELQQEVAKLTQTIQAQGQQFHQALEEKLPTSEAELRTVFEAMRDALQASENRFRRVFDSNVVGMMFTNFAGEITEANDRFLEMLGYNRAQLEAGLINWAEITPPEYRQQDLQAIEHLRQHGFIHPFEKAYRHQDGHLIFVLLGVAILSQTDESCVCVVVDISTQQAALRERTAAENALRESKLRLELALESSNTGLWDWNIQTGEVWFNKQWKSILGYQEHELENNFTTWQSRVHPEDEQRTYKDVAQHIQGQTDLYRNEHRLRCKDGSYRWILAQGRMVERDSSNRPLRFIGTHTDITDRKEAEQTIEKQAQRERLLRETNQRISQYLDLPTIFNTACAEICHCLQASRVGIFKFYPDSGYNDGEFVAESVVNGFPSVLAIPVRDHCFGENYASLYSQGRYYVANDIYHNGLENCHVDILSQFQVRANLVIPLLCRDELWGLLCIHQCDGPRYWQQSNIDLAQQFSLQLAIAIQQSNLFEQLQRELTERQQAEQQLTQRNEELIRATRLKDEFLANMSHELRTPLNAILGMTEGLQEEVFGPVNERQLKALQTVERSASHLLALINDILDLAKIESGQIELECFPTAIAPLCKSSITFVKHQALKKQIQISVNLPLNLPDIVLDERRIRQVLINLLNNAVKFTPEGGSITLEVTLPQATEEKTKTYYLRFAVIDTGIGISPENIKKLFQPFMQVDSALNRQYQGTGLGLALTKRIVDLHGGRVGLTSEVGVGSCFTIDLPYQASMKLPQPTKSEADLNPNDVETPSTPNYAPLLLLAEDNEANINSISSYLTAKGYRIELARNGEEAINQAVALSPDLILMDIQMPGMDGIKAMKRIRQIPELVSTPIVALTALAMESDRDRCLAAGANRYLSKPVKLKQLTITIQELLNSKLN